MNMENQVPIKEQNMCGDLYAYLVVNISVREEGGKCV